MNENKTLVDKLRKDFVFFSRSKSGPASKEMLENVCELMQDGLDARQTKDETVKAVKKALNFTKEARGCFQYENDELNEAIDELEKALEALTP